MDHLTPLQKAVFLGDRSGSVMELLSDEDRQKLQLLNRKTEKEVQIKEREKEVKKPKAEPFEEEPLKVCFCLNVHFTLVVVILGTSIQEVRPLFEKWLRHASTPRINST